MLLVRPACSRNCRVVLGCFSLAEQGYIIASVIFSAYSSGDGNETSLTIDDGDGDGDGDGGWRNLIYRL